MNRNINIYYIEIVLFLLYSTFIFILSFKKKYPTFNLGFQCYVYRLDAYACILLTRCRLGLRGRWFGVIEIYVKIFFILLLHISVKLVNMEFYGNDRLIFFFLVFSFYWWFCWVSSSRIFFGVSWITLYNVCWTCSFYYIILFFMDSIRKDFFFVLRCLLLTRALKVQTNIWFKWYFLFVIK